MHNVLASSYSLNSFMHAFLDICLHGLHRPYTKIEPYSRTRSQGYLADPNCEIGDEVIEIPG